ncbi:hypothetical protein EMIT0324P_21187 [Pseudomonas chlororaphis]
MVHSPSPIDFWFSEYVFLMMFFDRKGVPLGFYAGTNRWQLKKNINCSVDRLCLRSRQELLQLIF